MRSNVCTLILGAASLAPSALLAQPVDPAVGGVTIVATAPGKGVAERVAQIIASVEAVDSAKRSVTLKGPAGDIVTLPVGPEVQVRLRGPTRVVDLRIHDPEQFKLVAVGDQVEVTYTESVAISVEQATEQ